MRKNVLVAILALTLTTCLFVLTGCPNSSSSGTVGSTANVDSYSLEGSSDISTNSIKSTDSYDDYDSTSSISGNGEKTGDDEATLSQDKITYSSKYSLETSDYDNAYNKIKDLVKNYDSILESSNSGVSSNIRSVTLNIKVPADSYNQFKEDLSSICKVVSFSEDADNITKTYSDTEKRLEVAEQRVDRIYKIIEEYEPNINNVYELSSLYNELDSAQRDVESIKSSLLNMNIDLKYCDVRITLKDTHRYDDSGDIQGDGSWFSDRAYDFYNSTKLFRNVLTSLVTLIIYVWPYVLIFLVIFSIAARKPEKMWDKLGRKPKKQKKQKKQQMQQPHYNNQQIPPVANNPMQIQYPQNVVAKEQSDNESKSEDLSERQ